MNDLHPMSVKGLHEYLINIIMKLNLKGIDCLDLGCGTGYFSEKLKNLGFNVLSVDKERQIFASSTNFFQCDLNYDFAKLINRHFDLIVAIEVIEHLYSPVQFLKNVRLLLKEKGYIIITTPNLDSILTKLKFLFKGVLRQFDTKSDPSHISPIFLILC